MNELRERVGQAVRETGFSGVIRVVEGGRVVLDEAHGSANRAGGIPNTVDTRFGMASGSKTMTALAVLSLVAEGKVELSTTARALLGTDLPLIDDGVTVEHLLSHRSGIGDYLDEEVLETNDYILDVPLHRLADTQEFLPTLDGRPQVFSPGERFAYCNGAFVVLALICERVSGMGYHDLVMERVVGPAGMVDSGFFRSDELPSRTALGYLEGFAQRTNVLHLPVRGTGDGGMYTTAADVSAFWEALHGGRIVPEGLVTDALRSRTEQTEEGSPYGYGLGFWLTRARRSWRAATPACRSARGTTSRPVRPGR